MPGDDVAVFVSSTARRRAGPGLPHGLLPGPRGSPDRPDGLRPGHGPGRAGCHTRHRHGHLSVVPHADAQHHEGLAAGQLPVEARRRRRRGAVRPAHHPRRCVQGVIRLPEQCHHLAGLQPVGQLQPLLRPRQSRSVGLRQPRPCRVLRPSLSADLGLGRGRLRRQRAAAAVPPREPRAGPDLLDRRRPARPTPAAHEPQLPLQPGSRRVLVHSPCARGPPRPTPAGSTWPSSGPTPATARSGCSPPRSVPTACRSVTRTPPRIR